MDWTPIIGRHRPVEQGAVRVLTNVHQLGEQPSGARRWFVDTESQLQHLDHLVRHPIDLAYVLMDQVRSRGAELETGLGDLAHRVRRLLGAPRRGRHRPNLLRPFDPGSWHRWDHALALLGCRGLLRVEPLAAGGPGEGAGELRYRVTSGGARWLRDSVYPQPDDMAKPQASASGGRPPLSTPGATSRERCQLLRDVLPARLLRPALHGALDRYLRDTAQRLDAYRGDEQIRPGDDLLGRLFHSTFAEQL